MGTAAAQTPTSRLRFPKDPNGARYTTHQKLGTQLPSAPLENLSPWHNCISYHYFKSSLKNIWHSVSNYTTYSSGNAILPRQDCRMHSPAPISSSKYTTDEKQGCPWKVVRGCLLRSRIPSQRWWRWEEQVMPSWTQPAIEESNINPARKTGTENQERYIVRRLEICLQ